MLVENLRLEEELGQPVDVDSGRIEAAQTMRVSFSPDSSFPTNYALLPVREFVKLARELAAP